MSLFGAGDPRFFAWLASYMAAHFEYAAIRGHVFPIPFASSRRERLISQSPVTVA
jgi:hypothetical protein